jgi:hypothetical protein
MLSESTPSEAIRLIRGEYLEIPGLHLTRTQVQRFWNLDGAACDSLLGELVSMQFLRLTTAGGYVRADVATP